MTLVSVKVVEPPAKLPVTELEFIDQARLNGITVGTQPELLQRELAAATSRGENFCRRSFITQKVAALFVAESGEPAATALVMILPRGTVQSVESVVSAGVAVPYSADLEWGTVTLAALPVDPATVTFVSGYGDEPVDVPDQIKEGILEYATVLYEDRVGARESRYESGAGRGLPAGVKDLWRPFQVEYSG